MEKIIKKKSVAMCLRVFRLKRLLDDLAYLCV